MAAAGPNHLLRGADFATGTAKEAAEAVAGLAGEALEASAAAAAAAAALAACGAHHMGSSAASVHMWALACKHHVRDGAHAAAHAAIPPVASAAKAVFRWLNGARRRLGRFPPLRRHALFAVWGPNSQHLHLPSPRAACPQPGCARSAASSPAPA